MPGYTEGTSVRPDAELTYFMPYTALAGVNLTTLNYTAAWFTHFEHYTPPKMRQWYTASQLVDQRITTAPCYLDDLSSLGFTSLVKPGVDRDFFHLQDDGTVKGLIGVGGIASHRKGDAAAGFIKDQGYNVIASGKGDWGSVPVTWYAEGQMPAFYGQLEVFVCTSTVEGIPAPPFEALSCGTKVVIPSGVGSLDMLPEQPGIRHYKAGDYSDLVRAIDEALLDYVSAGEMRTRTEPFTVQGWRDSHAEVFEGIVNDA